MKITVKNFGPIGEAKDIHLSPMTLFVGPSSTGKSYLAVLLYAIVEVLRESRPMRIQSKKILKNVESVIKLIAVAPNEPIPAEAKQKAKVIAKDAFSAWAKNIGQDWRKKILYCFGEEGMNLIGDSKISVILRSDDGAVSLNLMSPQKNSIPDSALLAAGNDFLDSCRANIFHLHDSISIRSAADNFFTQPFVNLFRQNTLFDAHYLSAIRGGIIQNHRGLIDAVMAQAPFAGLAGAQMTAIPMPGVLSDFMRKLLDLRGNAYSPVPFSLNVNLRLTDNIITIGKQMEDAIMKGDIVVYMSETGYPSFRYKFSRDEEERELSLNNASSMVSELAPVSIFIRYHLGKGDLFIVEEPETNLHPGAQRDISDVLVRLANAGVFVLATTHSDVVLEQISNAVHRSEIKGKKPVSRGAKNGDVSMDEKDASVYSFAKSVKGRTVVQAVKFDSDTNGFITKDHLQASAALYNETVDLLDAKNND